MGFGQTLLNRKVERRQQITELVGYAGVDAPDSVWRHLGQMRGITPQAPCTKTCIKNEPRHNIAAVRE